MLHSVNLIRQTPTPKRSINPLSHCRQIGMLAKQIEMYSQIVPELWFEPVALRQEHSQCLANHENGVRSQALSVFLPEVRSDFDISRP